MKIKYIALLAIISLWLLGCSEATDPLANIQPAVTGEALTYHHIRETKEVSGNSSKEYPIIYSSFTIPQDYTIEEVENKENEELIEYNVKDTENNVLNIKTYDVGARVSSMDMVNTVKVALAGETVSGNTSEIGPSIDNGVYNGMLVIPSEDGNSTTLYYVIYQDDKYVITLKAPETFDPDVMRSIYTEILDYNTSTFIELPDNYTNLLGNYYYKCPDDFEAGNYTIYALTPERTSVTVLNSEGSIIYTTEVATNDEYCNSSCVFGLETDNILIVGRDCAMTKN